MLFTPFVVREIENKDERWVVITESGDNYIIAGYAYGDMKCVSKNQLLSQFIFVRFANIKGLREDV